MADDNDEDFFPVPPGFCIARFDKNCDCLNCETERIEAEEKKGNDNAGD